MDLLDHLPWRNSPSGREPQTVSARSAGRGDAVARCLAAIAIGGGRERPGRWHQHLRHADGGRRAGPAGADARQIIVESTRGLPGSGLGGASCAAGRCVSVRSASSFRLRPVCIAHLCFVQPLACRSAADGRGHRCVDLPRSRFNPANPRLAPRNFRGAGCWRDDPRGAQPHRELPDLSHSRSRHSFVRGAGDSARGARTPRAGAPGRSIPRATQPRLTLDRRCSRRRRRRNIHRPG